MKIFLADPHPQVRSALSLVLCQIPEVTATSEVKDLYQLLVLCSRECPDLVLIDLELVRPNRSHREHDGGLWTELFALVHRICPRTKVLAMSSRLEVEREALASGADGFISKTEPPEILQQKITSLLNG